MQYYAIMKELIQKLEIYRLENKISQQRLAAMLGVNFTTIYRWLHGKTDPNKIQTYHIKKLLEGHTK